MRVQRGIRENSLREAVEITADIVERMELEDSPRAGVVASYIMTRGAQRAWEAINRNLAGTRGGLFWIGGASGSGKTHFLNYFVALANRAGTLSGGGRSLTLTASATATSGAAEIDLKLLERLAHELAGDNRAASLWRQMRGADALSMAFDEARRHGVKSIAIAIDLADNGSAAASFITQLAGLAAGLKRMRLTIVAVGNGEVPEGVAAAFDVGAQDREEAFTVAIGRARRLDGANLPTVEDSYRNVDIRAYDGDAIFPLHPASIDILGAIAPPENGIGPLAMLIRDAIAQWVEQKPQRSLIYPADLMNAASVREAFRMRIGDSGCVALEIAYAAAGGNESARQIIDTLALRQMIDGPARIGLEELRAQIPPAIADGPLNAATLARSLQEIAARSRQAIWYDPKTREAWFNPRGAGAPEVAAFNAALPLIRRFDSTLEPVQEVAELKPRLKRLGEAMASALEGAYRNRDTLDAAIREAGGKLREAQERTFAAFVAIAEAGPAALVQKGSDESAREAALETIREYEAMAALASAVPRIRAMRAYLEATGLHTGYEANLNRDRNVAALETECQLLMVAINPAALSGALRNFDSLEARFQKFKWTYVQIYRAAHENWRTEMARLAGMAADARGYLDALARLNSIAALGSPEGTDLPRRMAAVDTRIIGCDPDEPLAPEYVPRCARCGFTLGASSPRDDLNDLLADVRRALGAKLTRLSQSAISRIIRDHDTSGRLDGFLKIVQAAQTDALVRVLDDKLTRYLAHLLDENAASRDGSRTAAGIVKALPSSGVRRNGGKLNRHLHRDANIKMPRDHD